MWTDKDDKITLLIARLIGLTNSKKITWRREPPDLATLPQGRNYLNYVYVTQAGDDSFRLSESEEKIYHNEEASSWEKRIDLDIIDQGGRTLWHCPKNPAIYHLFRIVSETSTDINGIIARLDSLRKAS